MIFKEHFDTFKNREVTLYVLKNKFLEVGITDFGGILQRFIVYTKDRPIDIACSAKNCQDYINFDAHLGGTIGRVANRIGGAKFTLNNIEYNLDKNVGDSTLHGGFNPYDYRFFDGKINGEVLTLSLYSPNLDQGFPGNLQFNVEFELIENSLNIRFFGKSDCDTLFNPTNHVYFNLEGEGSKNIYDTIVQIYGEQITLSNDNLVVTGELLDVLNTPFDFTKPKKIGKDIFSNDKNIVMAGGFDHNYVLKTDHVATCKSDKTGICLDMFTDYPGVQFYTGNMMKNFNGKSFYDKHSAFCLEPQYFPNAINIPKFEKPIIKANILKNHYIKYVISCD